MATRALIAVHDEKGQEFCTIYKHWDGSPDCLGATLCKFCDGRVITEGIPYPRDKVPFRALANGMHDLAAQLIHHLKSESPEGDVYVVPAGQRGVCEEYIYHIKFQGLRKPVVVEVEDVHDQKVYRLI